MKKNILFRICTLILVGITLSCEDRIRDNPFDKYNTLSPKDWDPINVAVYRESNNETILTWTYEDHKIEGFKIDRKLENNDWQEHSSLAKDVRKYIDSTAVASELTYSYRICAFAGKNKSSYVSIVLDEDRPQPVNIQSVSYNFEQMTVNWGKYYKEDFFSYELFYSSSQSSEKSLIVKINDINVNSYSFEKFDPTKENWYWIRLVNNLGLSTIGTGKTNAIDAIPTQSVIDSVSYRNDSFYIYWSENSDSDFKSYILYESALENMDDKNKIHTTNDNTQTSYILTGIGSEESRYYQLVVEDVWGLQSSSHVEVGYSHTVFAKTFGGASAEDGSSVKQTIDGGYIIVGTTESFGAGLNDIWIIKTDADGNEMWNKTFGGAFDDIGRSVQQTNDGGYIITGHTKSYGNGTADVWLIKTDASGNEMWNKTFGSNRYDYARDVQQTNDGGYIITGQFQGISYSDVWLIKTDASGNEMWNKTFGETNSAQYGHSIKQTTDGGYIVAGVSYIEGNGYDDFYLIKTDSQGTLEWEKRFDGGNGTGNDYAWDVEQAFDGGYAIIGTGRISGGSYSNIWLIKTDSYGTQEWNKKFGGGGIAKGFSIKQTADSGYIIAGETEVQAGNNTNFILIKTSSNGTIIWTNIIGGSGYDYGAFSVQQTISGAYILVGRTNSFGNGSSDIWLIKTTPQGATVEYN